ncbi:hypothetical protein L227DRAFT_656912 [Lentinus tigrinus ALCF2SS1-6]|uniref:Uncharacterized protein n=1 Tax=Lentinus tigrinus ALCF2SS1-6 TaxID=1328759 RepID=A0A5C2RWD5_9APHY|nr:hypothetical protein L227DRAFT_656912 [Lentinus tigrinus ALCF2SS1-6]
MATPVVPLVVMPLIEKKRKLTPGVALEDDEEITHLVHKLEEALSDIKYYPFSSATDVAMKKAGIVRTPHSSPLEHYKLTDPVTFAKHAARYRVMCAESAFLSADNFYAVYDAIVRHVSLNTEAGSRMLIDAFLLRVAAMVDNGHLLVFPEYVVPMIELCGPGDKFHVGGKLDYLLVLLLEEEKDSAAPLLKEPTTLEPDSTGFAIVEAKLPAYPTLSDALPQALLEVAAFAKKYKKQLMNGVITNGHRWMFFSFTPGADSVGGTFCRPLPLEASSPEERAVITGILKDMIDGAWTVVKLPIAPPAQGIAVPTQ